MRRKTKATSFDIAHLAGVSQADGIARAARQPAGERRRRASGSRPLARELNYKVDKHASSLRTQRSGTLALLLFEDPTAGRVAHQPVLPVDARLDHPRLRAPGAGPADLVPAALRRLACRLRGQQEGRRPDPARLRRLPGLPRQAARSWSSRARISCAGARCCPSQPGISIGCDNLHGGRHVGEHLLALGRRRIAFLGDASSHYPGILRPLSWLRRGAARGGRGHGSARCRSMPRAPRRPATTPRASCCRARDSVRCGVRRQRPDRHRRDARARRSAACACPRTWRWSVSTTSRWRASPARR